MNYFQLKQWNDKLTELLNEPEEDRGLGWDMQIGNHLEALVNDWHNIKPLPEVL
jgi:hypothetical protein